MSEENISWDEAVSSADFVSLVADKEKILIVTDFKLERLPIDAKVAAGEIEFSSLVVEEDGVKAVGEKKFNTTSKRLKQKLRPIFENKKPTDEVKLSILRVGDSFQTQFLNKCYAC